MKGTKDGNNKKAGARFGVPLILLSTAKSHQMGAVKPVKLKWNAVMLSKAGGGLKPSGDFVCFGWRGHNMICGGPGPYARRLHGMLLSTSAGSHCGLQGLLIGRRGGKPTQVRQCAAALQCPLWMPSLWWIRRSKSIEQLQWWLQWWWIFTLHGTSWNWVYLYAWSFRWWCGFWWNEHNTRIKFAVSTCHKCCCDTKHESRQDDNQNDLYTSEVHQPLTSNEQLRLTGRCHGHSALVGVLMWAVKTPSDQEQQVAKRNIEKQFPTQHFQHSAWPWLQFPKSNSFCSLPSPWKNVHFGDIWCLSFVETHSPCLKIQTEQNCFVIVCLLFWKLFGVALHFYHRIPSNMLRHVEATIKSRRGKWWSSGCVNLSFPWILSGSGRAEHELPIAKI